MAEDTFVRRLMRLREAQGLSLKQLSERVAAKGVHIHPHDLTLIANGRRALRPAEADVLAKALGTTVQDLLLADLQEKSSDALRAPSTEHELEEQVRAAEERLFAVSSFMNEAARRLTAAHERLAVAARELEAARNAANAARAVYQDAEAEKADLQHQYTYLLGRIDSLRAAKKAETGQQGRLGQSHTEEKRGSVLDLGEITVGSMLQRGRLGSGLTVEELQKRTRIPAGVITAIESNDFSRLPERGRQAHAHAHIQTLSEVLGMDYAALVKRYDAQEHPGQSEV
ncbi:helix-turn-helix domain-containing protein [Streptomyces sp. HGB0020]|uniref:helix-turn-helix domain-containing protein n=1 Tax=Streptomyces sp. HGB0020 TaxID=1078086 RepID=UPI001F37B7F9|nr:helix-turn-helix domain-containing protein [Streptomyces sp. HGB0020]